jgi:ferritin-like protein
MREMFANAQIGRPARGILASVFRPRIRLRHQRAQGPLTEPRNHQENEMSSFGYHEPVEELSAETRDMHRAIVSLMEELEAVDWYNQRADACKDTELKAILEHNRDEEKEHASMVLEWIRRKDPGFSIQMKDYLFTEKPITHK